MMLVEFRSVPMSSRGQSLHLVSREITRRAHFRRQGACRPLPKSAHFKQGNIVLAIERIDATISFSSFLAYVIQCGQSMTTVLSASSCFNLPVVASYGWLTTQFHLQVFRSYIPLCETSMLFNKPPSCSWTLWYLSIPRKG